jgi:hypothetical protein
MGSNDYVYQFLDCHIYGSLTTPALAMLFISATLFFTGSGKYSIDKD